MIRTYDICARYEEEEEERPSSFSSSPRSRNPIFVKAKSGSILSFDGKTANLSLVPSFFLFFLYASPNEEEEEKGRLEFRGV